MGPAQGKLSHEATPPMGTSVYREGLAQGALWGLGVQVSGAEGGPLLQQCCGGRGEGGLLTLSPVPGGLGLPP